MAGKHETPSKRSFYLSLATSTLRGLILVAAVALGLLGVTRAFPDGGERSASPSPSPTETARNSPRPTETRTSPRPDRSPKVKGVVVQVLNGTVVTGLAAAVSERLEEAGYTLQEPGNATETEVTIVYFQAGSRIDAEHLAERFFEGARVRPANQQAASDADITVVVGEDYAAREASPTPTS